MPTSSGSQAKGNSAEQCSRTPVFRHESIAPIMRLGKMGRKSKGRCESALRTAPDAPANSARYGGAILPGTLRRKLKRQLHELPHRFPVEQSRIEHNALKRG